jgi:glycogen debranching enzyme
LYRDSDAAQLRSSIARAESGIAWLWDDSVGAYCSRDVITGKSSGIVTSASFLSFYAGVRAGTRERRVLEHLERLAGLVQYLVPSLDPARTEFDSLRYWRGPVWAVVNYMIGRGLSEMGYTQWGERVRSDTRHLLSHSGMYEYFCPLTGRGIGGDDFSWTAAIWLCWLDAMARP